jgi:hypothetical protein
MKEHYRWLLNIIDSVDHSFQLDCCNALLRLFRQKYTEEEEFGPLYDTLLKILEAKGALLTV